MRDYQDAECDWARSTDCVPNGATASGSVRFVTAGGKELAKGELVYNAKVNWFALSAERALKAWAALPEAERKPGAVEVPPLTSVDPKRVVALKPPDGAMVLPLYNRQLAHDAKGALRYTVDTDYVADLNKFAPPSMWAARFAEVGIDWMWITRDEAEAMMPASPRPGQEVR